ncbi:hypothetical protein [Siphonobacter aquaeclarae]|uniref:hypothetical protein n=1 Tax=Siphonobacter aquaeclarae TaxID=563176 RepID=UPI00115FC795|nr:hypothetical protein [Siphonobacter aquaeclarae]
MKHILLENAISYNTENSVHIPQGYRYDCEKNAWYSSENNCYLVHHRDFPRIGTKKNDIETGEDQKGQ